MTNGSQRWGERLKHPEAWKRWKQVSMDSLSPFKLRRNYLLGFYRWLHRCITQCKVASLGKPTLHCTTFFLFLKPEQGGYWTSSWGSHHNTVEGFCVTCSQRLFPLWNLKICFQGFGMLQIFLVMYFMGRFVFSQVSHTTFPLRENSIAVQR